MKVCAHVSQSPISHDKNEKMKEKGKKKTERKEKIDKDEKYEKQGIGEQGEGEKLRKRREKIRGESFFQCGPKKGDHEQINIKGKFDKMKAKSDEKMSEKR